MTTDTPTADTPIPGKADALPPVPDAPGLPVGTMAYAEYRGNHVRLINQCNVCCDPYQCRKAGWRWQCRYGVEFRRGPMTGWSAFDDYAEALAEFERQAELLLAEEEA